MSVIQKAGGLKFSQQHILIIAHSGRMLANAVKQAGHSPLVIDLFADQDTVALAEQVWQVEDLSWATIQAVIECIVLNYKIQWLVYGSGMENQPETLAHLAECFTVAGNSAAVCKQLNDKKSFFKQLDRFAIAYPESQFEAPENNIGWLIKPFKHVGGIGVDWCNRAAKQGEYYQRFSKGLVSSVLFCADGKQSELIGFHRQWSVSQDNFTFAGIVQEPFLAVEVQQTVRGWLKKLVSYYQLKGLASLDFIWDGENCYFLEINPRPPASMALYPKLDLLNAHITGKIRNICTDKSIYGLQIIYARQACTINATFNWPEWSFDRPKINTRLDTNAPICSIIAQQETVRQTLDSLLARQQFIENNLY